MKWQQCQLTTKIRVKTPKTMPTLWNIYVCNDKSVSFKYLVFNSFLRKANLIENHSYTRKLSDLDRYCWLLRDLRDSFSNIEQSVPSYCYKVLYNIQSLNADVKGKSFRKLCYNLDNTQFLKSLSSRHESPNYFMTSYNFEHL